MPLDRTLLAAIAIVASAVVYLAALSAPFIAVGGVATLLICAAAYLRADERVRALRTGAVALALGPLALGAPLATPVVGAALLAGVLSYERTGIWSARINISVLLTSVLTVAGVAAFVGWGEGGGSGDFNWSQPAPARAPMWLLAVGLLVVAAINSVFEECMWRVVLADLPQAQPTPIWWLAGVSLGFGIVHFHGTPGGWAGVLATFLFALAMVLLRRLSGGGIILCVVVHACADVVLLGRHYV